MLGIKPQWVLLTFLAGMAVAVVTENLILEAHNNRLEFSAPRTDFFQGRPIERLRNALEQPFQIRTTLFSGNRNHVFTTTKDRFVISMDIFADSPEAFSVVKTVPPIKRASHLSASQAQAWCLSQMSLDTTGLSNKETLWARLEIIAEVSSARGKHSGQQRELHRHQPDQSVIDLFSRTGTTLPNLTLDYDAFTLDHSSTPATNSLATGPGCPSGCTRYRRRTLRNPPDLR